MPDIVEKLKRKIQELEHKLVVAGIDLRDSQERVERRNDDIRAWMEVSFEKQRKIEDIKLKLKKVQEHEVHHECWCDTCNDVIKEILEAK